MAARQPGVWGIDLGQCALKAIRLEVKDGEVVATAFEYIEHPKILSQPDADPDELTREALSEFLQRNDIKNDVIAISVPGQSGLARFVKLPPVDQKKIADIVKFEAKQQIPFPLEEVVWDFQPLSTGDIVDGMALETEIGLFAMKRDMVYRAIQSFKSVNVEVNVVQMAPLALCNFIAYDLLGKGVASAGGEEEDDHSCIVALEIGTDNSNLVITDGGRVIWQRPIPIGGNHFTRALTKEMKLTFAKAEHLKRNAAKSGSAELKKILSALKQVLNDFVGEVQRSLGYFTNTHRNAQIQYMIGLGNAFRLPGLQKFLQEKLQLEVRKFQGFDRATGDAVTSAPTFAENVMSFGVAYGLALQALKQTRLQTNLLPQEIRMEREIRKKKPWFVTAAACLLLGLTLLAFARGVEKNAVVNPAITEELKNLKKKVAEQKKQKDDFEAAERNLQNTLGSLNQIGAGVNERFNWQHLHQYMNFVLPQPNGDRLVSSSTGNVNVWEKYWKLNKNSQDAYAQLQKKIFSLTEVDPAEADKRDRFIKQHLLQVNIVGINALYSEDLAGYFRILHRDGPKLVGMTDEERERATELALVKDNEIEKIKKLPIFENKDGTSWQEGWVVEIRGYTTYQHLNEKADRFIEDTLIENLKRPDLLLNTDGKIIPVPKHIKLIRNRDERDRVGYFNLYKTLEVPNPVAGQYKLIGKSFLKTLIKGIDPPKAADANAPAVPPNPGQGDQGAPKVNRSTWMPVGEAAASIYGDVALGGLGGGNQGNQQGNQPAAGPHRTEFVVLFVWREPVTPTGQASTEKKN